MAGSRWAPPRQLLGFVALLVLLFFWAYYAGVLAGRIAPGIGPGGVETGVGRDDRPAREPSGGHGHGI
ncbi:hypothetical protein [Streptomyces thermolilacinus]|uniref:Uncharacterized protein n=1 Tax=Streptomyces thermolilacinus SPC6 TaxID=1306406 RepID=A0A1D3DVP7_9ACTN|nr:hypothetical protein [Streptomyces thermolilacinus]OEJ96393.1 hypothetical protein J116_019960 [Streptomyces thermolilacinus SPC6]